MKGKKEMAKEMVEEMGKKIGLKEALLIALSGREKRLEPLEEIKSLLYAPVIYGTGSGGCRALAGISVPTGLPYRPVKIAVNNCTPDLMRIKDHVDLAVPCGSGKGSAMDPEVGRNDIMQVRDGLAELPEGVSEFYGIKQVPDVLIVIASFGYGMGTGSALPLLRKLRERYDDSLILPFIITPFKLEGYKTMERAALELEAVCEYFTPVVVSNETVCRRYSINDRRDDDMVVYHQINQKIQTVISVLISSLTTEEGYATSTIDRSDLQRVFGKGGMATLTHQTFPSLDNFNLDLVKKAERLEWLETQKAAKDIERHPLNATYIVDGGGAFSLGRREEVNRYLFTEYNVDTGLLKPLIIKREKDRADFLLIKSGYKFVFDKGTIMGVY